MSLTELAALAEIIASLAVILSLIFVGFQVKEGNRVARVAAIQEAADLEVQYSIALAGHAEVWEKVVKGADLSEGPELREAVLLFNIIMTDTENRFHQHRLGYLQQGTWLARLKTLEKTCSLPIYPQWRCSISGQNHTEEFLQLVDEIHLKK